MNMPNKIVLYVSNIYPCKIGGMEIYNYHLVKELTKIQDSKRLVILSSCEEVEIGAATRLLGKEKSFFIGRYGLGTAFTILYYCFSSKIRWRDVKIIYLPYTSNFSYNAFPFLILKKVLKVNYVIHIHSGGLRESKPRWLLKSFFKNALKIAGVSYPIVEEYVKKTDRNVQYLPPLLPFKRSTGEREFLKKVKGFEMFERIILFVGSVKELKSPETLIKSFVELGDDFIAQEKLGLILVGDGPLRSFLEDKYGGIESIIFEGAIPNEDINEYYKLADIYAITSWFEGTSISLLEAMFNKLPCIGTNVSGIREIIEPGINGYLVEKDDYKDLSKTIKGIVSNYDDAKVKGENAYHYYQKTFSYKKHLLDMVEFLEV